MTSYIRISFQREDDPPSTNRFKGTQFLPHDRARRIEAGGAGHSFGFEKKNNDFVEINDLPEFN